MRFKEDLRVTMLINKNEDYYELLLTEEEFKNIEYLRKNFMAFLEYVKMQLMYEADGR